MENERGADSVLFSLDRVVAEQGRPPAPVSHEEGSGLVDIRRMLAQAKPATRQTPDERESSGLVDMNALMASAEFDAGSSDPGGLLSSPLGVRPIAMTPPSPAPEATRPAIPTGLLVGTIVALLVAIGVLAWKVLGA